MAHAGGKSRSPKKVRSRKRPRGKSRPKKWIQTIPLKKGALHRSLGIPLDQKIPLPLLRKAAKAPGKLGQRARFALRMRGFKHKRKGSSKSAAPRHKLLLAKVSKHRQGTRGDWVFIPVHPKASRKQASAAIKRSMRQDEHLVDVMKPKRQRKGKTKYINTIVRMQIVQAAARAGGRSVPYPDGRTPMRFLFPCKAGAATFAASLNRSDFVTASVRDRYVIVRPI